MILFEAIRALKPGQNIVTGEGTARWPYNEHIRWELGAPQPSFTFPCYNLKEEDDFRIIDLPAPKLTLPEAAKAIGDGGQGHEVLSAGRYHGRGRQEATRQGQPEGDYADCFDAGSSAARMAICENTRTGREGGSAMTLCEATRELKEGQAIRFRLDGDWILIAKLDWGSKGVPTLVNCGGSDWLNREVAIFNLPPPTLYEVLVKWSERIGARFYSCGSCKRTHKPCGGPYSCPLALIDTLQDIALEAGFDLKKITAGEDGA